MPNAEYIDIERELDEFTETDEQPRITGADLPALDGESDSIWGLRRSWLYLLLLCCAGIALAALLLPWWQHQRYYRHPTFRLALQRSVFLCDQQLGAVADVKIGHFHSAMGEEIAVVGAGAAFFTDMAGHRHSHVDFAIPGDGTQLVPAAGHYSFLQPGLTSHLAVMDQQGKMRWCMDGDCHAGRYAAGDLYGDGKTEYVAAWLTPHAGCLRLLGEHGQLCWERADAEAFFRDVAVVDARRDGQREIVYPDRDRLVLLDGRGHLAGKVRLPFPLETQTLCPWPTSASAPALLTVHHTLLWLIGFDGRPLAQRYLPGDYYDSASYYATPVKLRADDSPYFAVVLNNGQGRLLLYDPRGAIVHEEKLSQECSALFAIPSAHNPHTQDLLLCSEGIVWRLAAGKITPLR